MSLFGLIESSQEGDATVARVACRQIIDQNVINGIYQQVSKLSENQRDGNLVVDLADVEYMSGVTLSMFVLLDQAATKGGNRIGFCQLNPAVDELFRVSRFHKVVSVFGTRKEAIDGLSRNGHQSGRGKNQRSARRKGDLAAAKQLVGAEVTESESTMSGILPGLSQLAGDESVQLAADRAEMLASDLPTFAEPELVEVENLSDVELAETDLDTSAASLTDVEIVIPTDVLAQECNNATPDVAVSLPSHETVSTTLIGESGSEVDLADLDRALQRPNARSTTERPACEKPQLSEVDRPIFLEADWSQLFEAAETDFVLQLQPERQTTEKPVWVVVEPPPRPLVNQAATVNRVELITRPKASVKAVPDAIEMTPTGVVSIPEANNDELEDDDDEEDTSYDKHFTVLSTGFDDVLAFDQARAKIVGQRHVLLAEFLRDRKLDAVLLTRPSNFAWFTAGGQPTFDIGHEPTSALLITPGSRAVLCRNSDVAQMRSQEVAGLGFDLHDRMWFDDPQSLLSQAVRGRDVASDQPLRRCTDLSRRIAAMRLPLAISECQSQRRTARILSRILEIAARKIRRGELENDVAAQLLYRLAKNNITPVRVQVHADGRWQQNRQWNFGDAPIERFVTMSVIGQQKGLHVAMSRTVSFGPPPTDLRDAHRDTLLVQATAMYYSQHRADISEPWEAVERTYEKYGRATEWQSADLGCVTGYELCEVPILPDSRFELLSQMPLIWRAAIGPAFSMDTMLVRESIFKVLTKMEDWPQIAINVKGALIARPDILVRSA